MKKLTTATIATLGLVTLGAATANDASAAEQLNVNSQYTTTYSEVTGDYVTVDENGNKHHTLDGNWNPSMFNNESFSFYTVEADGSYHYYYYSNEATNYDYATDYTSIATPVVNNSYNTTTHNVDYNNYNVAQTNYTQPAAYTTTTTATTVEAPAATSNNNTNYNYNTTEVSTPAASTGLTYSSSNDGNRYVAGQCTYYAYDRSGGRVGSYWGNANNWANAARSAGYTVNNTPAVGAIMQSSAGGYGHVAYVENVSSNGSVTVSEMNYGHGAGVVTSRTLSAGQASAFNFIH
ncbi:CHAP domain-containing protein [Staphylococcus sp. 17KM0847]|uniref:CHAP domain-containing protein n=1 Tax=Staphylococcus sp. 17KM0847 TaxID=2583989 RepID=UPI0015DD4C18|nr:CHAP domain-containing protein [Staphylococcus sp. 17KM0847]QLK86804.1 CHAP domain-containing protein [Staphylococcus sp. 17KM0847]